MLLKTWSLKIINKTQLCLMRRKTLKNINNFILDLSDDVFVGNLIVYNKNKKLLINFLVFQFSKESFSSEFYELPLILLKNLKFF